MLVVLVLGVLLVFSTVDPTFSQPQQDQSLACGFGYEILATRLDQLELKLQNTLDKFNNTNTLLEKIVGILNLKQQHSRLSIWSCDEATATNNYKLKLPNDPTPIVVYCDMEVLHGRWLVIQQRLDGSVDFNRNWTEYRDGFGVVGQSSEFWLGLETIHQLTKAGDHELLVELKNENGQYGYARYARFQIAGEDHLFQISSVGEFRGTIGDALFFAKGYKFSTYDRDNDDNSHVNCAQIYSCGSWFNKLCGPMYINGPYKINLKTGYGIHWYEWTYAATYSRMLIRRK